MFRAAVFVLAVGVLVGCQTKTVEEMNYTERRQLAEEITKRCYAQGVKPGTAEFRDCSSVEAQREIAARRRQAAFEDTVAAQPRGPNFCQRFGNTVQCF